MAMDGSKDVYRPHGQIPNLWVLLGDRSWERVVVMEEWIVRDACGLVLTSVSFLCDPPNLQCPSCNLQFIHQKLGLFFFFSLFFFLKTTRASHGGFHPNFLPWAPPREVFTQGSYSFLFSLLSNPLTASWRFSINEPI